MVLISHLPSSPGSEKKKRRPQSQRSGLGENGGIIPPGGCSASAKSRAKRPICSDRPKNQHPHKSEDALGAKASVLSALRQLSCPGKGEGEAATGNSHRHLSFLRQAETKALPARQSRSIEAYIQRGMAGKEPGHGSSLCYRMERLPVDRSLCIALCGPSALRSALSPEPVSPL